MHYYKFGRRVMEQNGEPNESPVHLIDTEVV